MKAGRLIALCVALPIATPTVAQTPINIVKDSCLVLVSQLHNPDTVRPDLSLYVEGLLNGTEIALDLSRDELKAQIVPACFANPVLSVRKVLDEVARR